MPQIFSIGSYVVYFWSDEGEPKEPVHVHVAQGRPQKNGTKIQFTFNKSRRCGRRLSPLGRVGRNEVRPREGLLPSLCKINIPA